MLGTFFVFENLSIVNDFCVYVSLILMFGSYMFMNCDRVLLFSGIP